MAFNPVVLETASPKCLECDEPSVLGLDSESDLCRQCFNYVLGGYDEEDQNKIIAVAKVAEVAITDAVRYFDSEDWLALTDDEADDKVEEYIQDSVWAFNASFLASFTDLPEEMFSAIQEKCEGANDAILTCIERTPGGLDEFVKDAISADGRGPFLAHYDHEEHEISVNGETYYCYRLN